ncbi:STAS domain-containing protein [Nocardioides sp. URHA0020]|uniref:STAS domain-containing protein n=1 Tax=Nocardioides sp. URHA0020 TaxID=1380392 RepID=UPI000685ECE0|nr:STAS domain-containing protein [Nocardioides sp. URHA0020]
MFSSLALHAPSAHLVVDGELDAFTAAELRSRLDEAIDRGCVHFTVDASAVTFVDAGALGMLVGLRNAVAPYGGTVSVAAASPRFRLVAEVAGLDAAFDLDLLPAVTAEPSHRPSTYPDRSRVLTP